MITSPDWIFFLKIKFKKEYLKELGYFESFLTEINKNPNKNKTNLKIKKLKNFSKNLPTKGTWKKNEWEKKKNFFKLYKCYQFC